MENLASYCHDLMETRNPTHPKNPNTATTINFHSAAFVLDFREATFLLILAISGRKEKNKPHSKHSPRICDNSSPSSPTFAAPAFHHGNKAATYHARKIFFEMRLSFRQPWRSPSTRSATVTNTLLSFSTPLPIILKYHLTIILSYPFNHGFDRPPLTTLKENV
ncbi:hypothetical protein Ahy_A04g018587 isoform A [Arachis hypogaea]|uniref:Uncharacterized protein n=1 Tax=Arachis hypogaea TaxID=3818 RepID=A0A445DE21_ARAHY|nr:hypothetical protein Ahy_A04g018587 isoform A [Arachis hypogaea]